MGGANFVHITGRSRVFGLKDLGVVRITEKLWVTYSVHFWSVNVHGGDSWVSGVVHFCIGEYIVDKSRMI